MSEQRFYPSGSGGPHALTLAGRTQIWKLFGCGLFLLLALLLFLAYRQAERQAESTIGNLNLVLEARLDAGLLQPLQASLLRIAALAEREVFQGQEAGHALIERIGEHTVNVPSAIDFELVDPKGRLIYSSGHRHAQPSLDQLHYWAVLSRRPSADAEGRARRMLIEQDKGNELLRAAVPVVDAQHQLLGWVTASLPLNVVLELFGQVDIGPRGAIAIRRIDRPEVILRNPPRDNPYGSLHSDALSARLAAGVQEGTLHMRSQLDGVARLYGFKRIGQYPLALTIGLASDDYLREWYYMLGVSSGLCALLFLLILGLDKRLHRVQVREALAADELRRTNERTGLLLDTVGHAILGIGLEGNCTFGNAACVRLFGVSDGQHLACYGIDHYLRPVGSHCDAPLGTSIIEAVRAGDMFHYEGDVSAGRHAAVLTVELRAYPNWYDGELVGAVVTVQDISERKQAEQCISFMAYHDVLTGLPNRRQINERITQAIEQVSRVGGRFTLLYLDVDHFKTINDSLGHVAGDAVLRMLAERLERVEGIDTVARLGGDEYLILAPEGLGASQERLLAAINALVREPWAIEGGLLEVKVSIGVARYPEHGEHFDSLFRAADVALNQAKKNGRNRHAVYTQAMGATAQRRLQLQMELRRAIEHDELIIHYQPQIDLASGRVIGAEALIRWQHPQRGMVAPGVFIAEAESSGLIVPIGGWLLRAACCQAAAWQQAGLGDLVIAVNCSVVQFKHGNLVNEVAQALALSGLQPSRLELELTESILIEDTERMIATVRELKALGIKLSIDDFGTGYSSMAYLKHLAVDKLKIDQSFIFNLADSADDSSIVQAMITLGHNLKLRVIAEGVESETVLGLLAGFGCDEVQGFHFSRPLPAGEFASFISASLQREDALASRRLSVSWS